MLRSLNTGASTGDIMFNDADLAVDGGSGDSNDNNGVSATTGIRSGQTGTLGISTIESGSGWRNPTNPQPRRQWRSSPTERIRTGELGCLRRAR